MQLLLSGLQIESNNDPRVFVHQQAAEDSDFPAPNPGFLQNINREDPICLTYRCLIQKIIQFSILNKVPHPQVWWSGKREAAVFVCML